MEQQIVVSQGKRRRSELLATPPSAARLMHAPSSTGRDEQDFLGILTAQRAQNEEMHNKLRQAEAHARKCSSERDSAKENEAQQQRLAELWKAQYLDLVEKQKEQMSRSLADEQKRLEDKLNLQSQLDKARETEAQLQAQLTSATSANDALEYRVKDLEQQMQQGTFDAEFDLRTALENSQAELDVLSSEHGLLRARHDQLQTENQALTAAADAAQQRETELRAALREEQAAFELLEERNKLLQKQADAAEGVRAELDNALREIVQLSKHASAADEAAHLRTELLELIELSDRQKVRVQQAEQQLAEALDKVEEREQLKAQVEGLREALNSAQEVTGERDIKSVLQDYQKRELEAAQTISQHLESIERLAVAERTLQAQCDAATAQLQAANERAAAAEARALDLEASVQVYAAAARDVQALWDVKAQEALSPTAQSPVSPGAYAAVLKQVQTLNRSLLESQEHIERLRAQDRTKADAVAALRLREQEVATELAAAKRVEKQAERQAQQLKDQVRQLQLRLGAGDFNRAPSKILHLKMNPAAISRADFLQQELSTVQAENDALRERILSLECSGGGNAGSSGGGVEAGVTRLQAELRVAQQTAADVKARSEKMTTHFVEASRKFRDAVGQITGWSIKMILKPGERDLAHFRIKPYEDTSNGANCILLTSHQGVLEMDPEAEWLSTKPNSALVDFYYNNPATRSIPALLANLLQSLK